MYIFTNRLFSEVNTSFSISYKVDLKIREYLNEYICPYLKFPAKEQNMDYMYLSVSTKKDVKEVEVKGPDISRKDKEVVWALWLPYHKISNESDQRERYIKFYFEALVMLFERYNIDEELIRQVQTKIEKEVIGNKEYEFEEEDVLEVDLSDLDLD
ncbi:hypothetical protein [Fictibacillus sp. BK138]|uniref:hypothetical protein n=1 Tax=Fictibacillus sp. BK138 TaxID=2512121 RepID=UPI00102A7E15|nr:hypothetical protein [Fictibacillus sp. BK138]RZT15536.1 hypothetical protein EV282_3741 [Fictibacillus sp. BK138]